jgi:hypothetical protein
VENRPLALPLYHALVRHGTHEIREPLQSAQRLDLDAIRIAVEAYDMDAQGAGRGAFRSFPPGIPLASPWTRWYGEWAVPTDASDLVIAVAPEVGRHGLIAMHCGSLVDSLHLPHPRTTRPSRLWFMLAAFLGEDPDVRSQFTAAESALYERAFRDAPSLHTLGDLIEALPTPVRTLMAQTAEATRWVLTAMHFSRIPAMSPTPFVNGATAILLDRSGHVFHITERLRSFWGCRVPGPTWCGLRVLPIPTGDDAIHMLALHHKVLTHTLITIHTRQAVLGDVLPTRQERRAAVRDGNLPPLSYTILAIPTPSAPSGRFPTSVARRRAVHIRRGHFKAYTRGRGLFGRYHGVFWWDEKTVGTAPRIRVKDYLVRPTDG